MIEEISIPLIEVLLKNNPLESRLKIDAWFAIINFITAAGYRENKMWTDNEDQLEILLGETSHDMAKRQIQIIKEWMDDGEPGGKLQ